MDVWTTIKVLFNRGVSIRQIAKQLKISRNTVRKCLNKEGPLRYEKSARYGSKSKWAGWKKEIIEMYYNKKFVGSRIFEELKKRGAEGSIFNDKVIAAAIIDRLLHHCHLYLILDILILRQDTIFTILRLN